MAQLYLLTWKKKHYSYAEGWQIFSLHILLDFWNASNKNIHS